MEGNVNNQQILSHTWLMQSGLFIIQVRYHYKTTEKEAILAAHLDQRRRLRRLSMATKSSRAGQPPMECTKGLQSPALGAMGG
jgi:hypothetical protein